MTPQQLATLKAAILADPQLASKPMNSDGAYDIAKLLEAPSSPPVIVWRTAVQQDEIMQNGFDWVQVDNLTVGKARIWEWMFSNESRSMNPSKLNVRAGIDEAWKGTAAMLAVRAAVYVHCKRTANRGEAIFATGLGTDASPSTLSIEGSISWPDIEAARVS